MWLFSQMMQSYSQMMPTYLANFKLESNLGFARPQNNEIREKQVVICPRQKSRVFGCPSLVVFNQKFRFIVQRLANQLPH